MVIAMWAPWISVLRSAASGASRDAGEVLAKRVDVEVDARSFSGGVCFAEGRLTLVTQGLCGARGRGARGDCATPPSAANARRSSSCAWPGAAGA